MSEVEQFLSAIGLPQYAGPLISNGYDDLSVLPHLTLSDLSDPALGISPGHQRKILINAEKLSTGEPLTLRSDTLTSTLRGNNNNNNSSNNTMLNASNGVNSNDVSNPRFKSGEATKKKKVAGPLSQTARRVDSYELQHVRTVVKKRGGDGINGLSRIFRLMDDVDGNKKLSKAEFITGLQNYGVRLSKEQFNSLFSQFDRNGDAVVSVTEFLRAIAGSLNKKRREIVDAAFAKFDRDGSGIVTIDDLVGRYKVDGNPDVQSGRKTAQQVLTDFLNSFQAGNDGRIGIEEFREYYANVSIGIDSDEAFELLLSRSWSTKTNAKLDSYAGAV